METGEPVKCPKCGREVADDKGAASAVGGTVLCKGCGALVPVGESAEQAAKAGLDSDFDLEICFEREAGPTLPASKGSAGTPPARASGSEIEAREGSVARERGEPKRRPEPVAPEDWKWAGDKDFDPLRELPRRDTGEESRSGEATSVDEDSLGPPPEWKSARPARPVAPSSTELPPPSREVEVDEPPPIYELPPKERAWEPRKGVAPAARTGGGGTDWSGDAAADEEGAPDEEGEPSAMKPAVEETSDLPSPSEAEAESKKLSEVPLPDEPATALGAAVAMKRRRRNLDTAVSKRAVLSIVIVSLAVVAGVAFWLARESPGGAGAAKVERLSSEDVLRGFLAAETASERADFVWQSDRLRSAVEAYYVGNGYEKSTIAGMRKMTELQVGAPEEGVMADVYEVQLSDRGAVVGYVIRAPGRVLGVDWESFEDIASTPFPEFQAGRMPTPTRFRAHAYRDDALWTGEFSDPKRWFCLRLESPKQAWSVFAYAEKNSIIGEQIRQIFNIADNEIMTVELAYPLGSTSNEQVLLERVVSLDWLTQQ